MNRPAQRAKLRARVSAAEQRLREIRAVRDWLGIRQALADYWLAKTEWSSV